MFFDGEKILFEKLFVDKFSLFWILGLICINFSSYLFLSFSWTINILSSPSPMAKITFPKKYLTWSNLPFISRLQIKFSPTPNFCSSVTYLIYIKYKYN